VLPLSLAAFLSPTSAFAFEPIIALEGHSRTIERDGGTDILLATREETDGRMWVIILPNVVGNGPGPAIVQSRGAESWYVLDGSFEFHVGDKTFDGGPGWGRAHSCQSTPGSHTATSPNPTAISW